MNSLRQIGAGILLGVLSIAAILGGFALSRAEGGALVQATSPASATVFVATAFPTVQALTASPTPSATETLSATPESTFTQPASQTPPPPPTSCPPPIGWVAIQVTAYDTLTSLAQRYLTTAEAIKQGNCLSTNQLVSGAYLYVPPRPTATFIPCGAPYGWVTYYVTAGDTLYNLSLRYRVPIAELQRANCMGSSIVLAAGKPIKVPNVLTSTSAVRTATWTAIFTQAAATSTSTQAQPTSTNTAVPTPEVPTAVTPPTATTQPTPTATLEPTPVTPVSSGTGG